VDEELRGLQPLRHVFVEPSSEFKLFSTFCSAPNSEEIPDNASLITLVRSRKPTIPRKPISGDLATYGE
jgi:hypothetical protein